MKVAIEELREISNRLLDHVESLGVNEVNLSADYYWTFPSEQLYDPSLTALEPSLGQLTDDWNELQLIRHGERPPVAAALGWLGAIMRAVGEEVIGQQSATKQIFCGYRYEPDQTTQSGSDRCWHCRAHLETQPGKNTIRRSGDHA